MLARLSGQLRDSWFFPRYIAIAYIEPALREVKHHVRGRMLDVGCGTRRYERIFRDQVDCYIGLDWPDVEERAAPDVVGDAMRIPVHAAAFDVVLATELMEHLPSPHSFLTEVSRVLRDGGCLILSVPFMEPIHEPPRDFYRFTPFSLRLLLEDHGFSLQKIWSKGGWWSVVFGSFLVQSLYDWATSPDAKGRRRYGLMAVLVLPVCASIQWLAYGLDRLFPSQKYTLGYTLLAVRERHALPERRL